MEGRTQKEFAVNELQSKCILTEIKTKLTQTMCYLLEDEIYTKNDAVIALIDVVQLIELEEKSINSKEIIELLVRMDE